MVDAVRHGGCVDDALPCGAVPAAVGQRAAELPDRGDTDTGAFAAAVSVRIEAVLGRSGDRRAGPGDQPCAQSLSVGAGRADRGAVLLGAVVPLERGRPVADFVVPVRLWSDVPVADAARVFVLVLHAAEPGRACGRGDDGLHGVGQVPLCSAAGGRGDTGGGAGDPVYGAGAAGVCVAVHMAEEPPP